MRDRNSISIIENNNSLNPNYSKTSDDFRQAAFNNGQVKSHTPINMLRNFVVSQPLQPPEHELIGLKKMSHSTAAKIA